MNKCFSISLTVGFVSIVSFSAGYIAGELSENQKDKYVKEILAKQVQAIERVTDASMFSSEPYSSFYFSTILLEAIIEQPDTALSDIQTILVQEIESRKDGVADYCRARATEQFRSLCLSTIDDAGRLVEKSGT